MEGIEIEGLRRKKAEKVSLQGERIKKAWVVDLRKPDSFNTGVSQCAGAKSIC